MAENGTTIPRVVRGSVKAVHQSLEDHARVATEAMTAEDWLALCEMQAEWWCKQLTEAESG